MKARYSSNYQDIVHRLTINDPSFTHLDLRKIQPTEEHLREIASKIQDNDFIGNVSWGIIPNSCGEFVKKIENKIILNNQNY
ncbi:MAG TPA: hypothetical protein LFW21_06575 [Rickettsia endosymbiont of Pyrocoelia pectoralis]|nr:hypothetical protein [Rickettsia endosymbiont of Pyrocoelia pectoralis]